MGRKGQPLEKGSYFRAINRFILQSEIKTINLKFYQL